jgi:AraC-like DNA-binding protein
VRIRHASELLQGSSLSVTQICHRVGFNSLSHFTTTFRMHTGMSPSRYRRMVDWEQDHGRFSMQTEALVKQPRHPAL